MALQSHFLVAHFPLQTQGLLSDALSLLAGKAGVLNCDFLLATTCSFEQGRSEGYVFGGVHAHFLPTKWAWPKRGMGVVWARFRITT